VKSANIKEADGTTGQKTNIGSGIKTGHIQNAAVTTAKLKANAVATAKIADGAVTDAKITGPITASKIGFTGLNADTLDGSHAAAFSLTGHNHNASYVNVGGDTMTGRLTIKGNGWPSSFLFLDTNAAAQDSGIRFYENGTVKSHLYWKASDGNLRLYGSGFSGIDVTSVGSVGIGTTSPSAKLHAVASSGTGLYGTSATGRGVYAYSEGTTLNAPALFAYNPNATAGEPAGIAIYARNNGGDSTIVARNTGTGDTFRSINSAGNSIIFRVTNTGRVVTSAVQIYGGGDLAERFEVRKPKAEMTAEPGMVVSIDPDNPGKLVVSGQAYDKTVAGIISGAGGIESGMVMAHEGTLADGTHAVALTGRVYCMADASKGAIKPGDLLTSADVPGYAMKATDYFRAQGAIIGKAMTGLDKGTGLVLVLVTLQ
jgi:hypothetical protein